MQELDRNSLEFVIEEWSKDSKLDDSRLDYEISRTPSLHSKYLTYYVHFKNELSKADFNYNKLGNVKRRYYKGECTKEELENYGWTQFTGLKPSFQEMVAYLEFDNDLMKIKKRITDMKTAVSTCEYILKSITGRDYLIKSQVEYQKFLSGA